MVRQPAQGFASQSQSALCRQQSCMAQVHGTCLGFEALAVIVSQNSTVLSKCAFPAAFHLVLNPRVGSTRKEGRPLGLSTLTKLA